jgi:hypothetical protein
MFDAIEALKLAPEELGRLARLLDEVIQKARLVITSHASVITAMMDTSSDVVQARVKDGLAGMASRYVQFLLEGGNA